MRNFFGYATTRHQRHLVPNRWDMIALLLAFSILVILALVAKQFTVPYKLGQAIPISLSISHLPGYALQTVMRMLIALLCSLLFTFTVATLAAKNKHAEKIIIPIIDILQSIPVLGFLSITTVGFIELFPGSMWGPECASIFAIFTSQVWNIALSFYQSLRTVPDDLKEAAAMFHLSGWQRFWRIEVPFAMPGLLWNIMLSMSASWFFVVASEAFTISNQNISLPGIGSYIATAIAQANIHAVIYAIFTMFLVILLYDQLLFRPLVRWAEKFKSEQTGSETTTQAWSVKLFRRSHLLRYVKVLVHAFVDKWVTFPLFNRQEKKPSLMQNPMVARRMVIVWYVVLVTTLTGAAILLARFIYTNISLADFRHVLFLGSISTLRVFATVIVSTIIWLPIGVWIGLKPRVAQIAQPIVQFLAAFPTYVLFPVVVIMILRYHLNVEIWVTPLMLLGTQWYILFNVIAGAAAIPKDLRQAAANFGVTGWLWWRRLILPGIFPYYITGAITAAGNAWNTTVAAEVVSWGQTTLRATGLGAYIAEFAASGNFTNLALGIGVMSLIVLTFNHLLWRPLYTLSKSRYQLE